MKEFHYTSHVDAQSLLTWRLSQAKYPNKMATLTSEPPISIQVFRVSNVFPASFGAIFPTTLSCPPVAVAVQAVPQAYPDGQHPPPTFVAQVDHPLAHDPVSKVITIEIPLPVGASIVTLLPATTVMLAPGGQDVGWQSLPV